MGGDVSGSGSQEHCFRIVGQGGLASTKNGTQASLLATSQANVASTHRSSSRDNVQVGSNHYHGPYSRKSAVGTGKTTAAHQTPINTNSSIQTNRVAQKVKASQLSASSLHSHQLKMASY